MPAKSSTSRFVDFVHRFEIILIKSIEIICFVLMCFIVVDILIAVSSRYVFFSPLNFADQLAKYILIWIAFLGATLGIKKGAHISIDLLKRKLSFSWQWAITIGTTIVVSAFLLLMIVYGFKFAWSARIFKDPLVFWN